MFKLKWHPWNIWHFTPEVNILNDGRKNPSYIHYHNDDYDSYTFNDFTDWYYKHK